MTAKLRLLPEGVGPTVELCERIEDAGASVVTLHGRTRMQVRAWRADARRQE